MGEVCKAYEKVFFLKGWKIQSMEQIQSIVWFGKEVLLEHSNIIHLFIIYDRDHVAPEAYNITYLYTGKGCYSLV